VDKVIVDLLGEIQQNIFDKALQFREDNTHHVDTYDEFKEVLESKGGFIYAHWDGTAETELKIKEETKATIRCIPFRKDPEEGKCMVTGNPSKQKVLFARAY
jgi:prolyl-tRNA synthetase